MNTALKSILETPLADFTGSFKNPPKDLLAPENGVVEYYMNNPPYYDEPKIYGFASLLNTPPLVKNYHAHVAPDIFIGFAGGASIDKNRALWKVIGESIERYALFTNGKKGIKGSYTHLTKLKKNLLDPNIIFSSTKRMQLTNKRDLEIEWLPGKDLTNHRDCFIPTQLIAVPYWDSGKEIIWRAPITTGAATGSSIQSAIFGGICEVIERDAFMVSWLKQLRLKQIIGFEKIVALGLDTYSDLLNRTLQAVDRYKLFPEFYMLANDTCLHSIMCVLKDQTGIGPPLTVGLDTDISIAKTMLGALEECLQLRPWVRQLFENSKRKFFKKQISFDIENLEQRASLWTTEESIKVINNWLCRSEPIQLQQHDFTESKKLQFKHLIDSVSKNNATVYFVDLTKYTPKCVRQRKLVTVKVVIPEYQPLYLIERYADHVWQRLESAENRLHTASLIEKNNLQKYPHPML